MRRVSSAWPSTLLILCEPVCVRSSRFSSTRTPSRSESRWHSVTGVGPARVARQQRRVLGAERVVVPRGAELGLELLERGHERLGREPAAELAEAAEPDGLGPGRLELHGRTSLDRCHPEHVGSSEQASGGLYGAALPPTARVTRRSASPRGG